MAEWVIMDTNGHSTEAMFDRYNTIDWDERKEAMNQLKDYFATVIQSVTHAANQKISNEVTL